jgi:hypothetical protein
MRFYQMIAFELLISGDQFSLSSRADSSSHNFAGCVPQGAILSPTPKYFASPSSDFIKDF